MFLSCLRMANCRSVELSVPHVRIYKEQSGSDESFDSFVFGAKCCCRISTMWINTGLMPTTVYQHYELKQIDQLFNVFTEKQVEAIRRSGAFRACYRGQNTGRFRSYLENFAARVWAIPGRTTFRKYSYRRHDCRDVADRLRAKEEIPEFAGNSLCLWVSMHLILRTDINGWVTETRSGRFLLGLRCSRTRDADNQASRFYAENMHIFPSNIR